MLRLICSLTLGVFLSCADIRPAAAQANLPFLGEIEVFGFAFCPTGWLPAQGQVLQISQNVALFSLLGTTYGGDGLTTFALPNWGQVRSSNGGAMTTCIAIAGVFPPRN